MKIPDFLIVGAPRSGTTFLSRTLSMHPDICFPRIRETHFFDRYYEKGIRWYSEKFIHCRESNIIGEKTAIYLFIPECPERIKKTIPNVKIVAILRNPIDRAYSHYKNMIRLGRIKQNTKFNEIIENNERILEMGNYYSQIKRYYLYFDKKDFLIIFFDDLINRTENEYKKILEFLNVKVIDMEIVEVDNQTKLFYKIYGHILTRRELTIINTIPLIKNIKKYYTYNYPDMNKDDRKKLLKYYKKENEKLFEFLGLSNRWG
jgi:hypothetical protein